MSLYLLLCLAAFGGGMVHALVITGWKDTFAKGWRNGDVAAAAEPQQVSVVVPARNAGETLTPLLQDLHAQAWPKEMLEVLVVNDGSTDGTAALVRSMARTWPGLRLIECTGEGKKAAITQGVAEARGEWVVLTDADARCGPGRVRAIMDCVAAQAPGMLLMPVATIGTEGVLQALQAEEQAALMGMAAGTALQGAPMLANGANMAFRRSAFQAVGGYAGEKWASGDDVFLLRRMLKTGRKVHYLLQPEVLVRVEAERGFRAFWRQRLRWAGKMRGVGGAWKWVAMAGLLWPWFLLFVTGAFGVRDRMAQNFGASLMLLTTAWLLWLLPITALVREVHRFQNAAGATARPRLGVLRCTLGYAAFHLYAPVIAAASLVVRPKWKGRRV